MMCRLLSHSPICYFLLLREGFIIMNRSEPCLPLRFITVVLALTTAISSPGWSADWDPEAATKIADQLPPLTGSCTRAR